MNLRLVKVLQKSGLTPDEVADLSEAEYGLNQYRLNDIAVVQRLRDAGIGN